MSITRIFKLNIACTFNLNTEIKWLTTPHSLPVERPCVDAYHNYRMGPSNMDLTCVQDQSPFKEEDIKLKLQTPLLQYILNGTSVTILEEHLIGMVQRYFVIF